MSTDIARPALDLSADEGTRPRHARLNAEARIASWAFLMGQPRAESRRDRSHHPRVLARQHG